MIGDLCICGLGCVEMLTDRLAVAVCIRLGIDIVKDPVKAECVEERNKDAVPSIVVSFKMKAFVEEFKRLADKKHSNDA